MSKTRNKHAENYRTNPFTHNYQGMYSSNPFLKDELKKFYRNSEMFIKYGNRFKIPEENKKEVADFLVKNFNSDMYSESDIKIGVIKILGL